MSAPLPPPAVSVQGLAKVFPRHFHDARSLKEILVFRPSRGHERPPLVALRDVSFEARPGEMVGIVGTNGAGKSTLLRVVAGITPATEGTVHVRGRIGSLLELGAGFQDDLSGVENIFLAASVMGVARDEVERWLDPIIDFAGLRRFIHTPVKFYSTGMYIRLGFSVVVHFRPEVLLIDEVLSVGDAEFQDASFRRLLELRDGGAAGLLVSHDLHTLEALCDRLLWIEHGQVRAWDTTDEVLHAYRTHLHGGIELPERRQADDEAVQLMPEGRMGTGEVTIDAVRFLGADERATQMLRPGEPMAIELDCTAARPVDDADVMVTVEHEGLKPTMISAKDHGYLPEFRPGRQTLRIDFPQCLFNIGAYKVTVAILKRDDLHGFYDHHIRLHRFTVLRPAPTAHAPPLHVPAEFTLKSNGA